jgi:PAS domain S-box-containing protein
MLRAAEKPLRIALVAMAALILITAGIAFFNIQNLATLRNEARATQQRRNAICQVVRAELEAETGQRGYLLTGNETYLAPYRDGVEYVHQWLAELDRLTPHDTAQQRRIDALHSQTENKLAELSQTIELRRTRGLEAAVAMAATNRGKALMDQIMAAADALMSDADKQLLQNRRDFDRAESSAIFTCFITGGAGLIGLWGFWAFVQRDIAILRRSEQSMLLEQERLRVTLASVGDAVIVTNAEGRITFLNSAAETLTGWCNKDAEHRAVEEVFVICSEQTGQPVLNPARRVLMDGVTVGLSNDIVLINRSRVQIPIDDTAAPIRDGTGRLFGVVLVFRDAAQQRRAENELKLADRHKDEFLATLAHELRNPIGPLSNAWRLVRDPRSNAAIREKAGDIIERQLAIMVRLIDDLLDIARIKQNKLELRKSRISVNRLLGNAVEMCEPKLSAGTHRFTINRPEPDFDVEVDPIRLAQAICNLLTNALKFTPAGGAITLSARREGPDWLVSVRDTGQGIPPDMLERIFEMFIQNHRTAGPRPGLGIGLALVKHIVEMHGGAVSVSSRGLGQGAEFHLRLPVRASDAATSPVPSGVAAR